MASRYHWLTAGVDAQFNLALPTAQANAIALPAGAQMKRFIIRQCFWQATNNGTGGNNAFDISIRWNVKFTAGANINRVIWQSYRHVPFTATIFTPISGSNTWWWSGAGDNELGVDQKATYGKSTDPAASILCSYSVLATRFASMSNLFGEFGFQFAVLYYL